MTIFALLLAALTAVLVPGGLYLATVESDSGLERRPVSRWGPPDRHARRPAPRTSQPHASARPARLETPASKPVPLPD